MTPADFYILQWRYNKRDEDKWEHTREVIAMIHNASPNAKRSVRGREIIELSRDGKVKLTIDREFFDKAMKALN